MAKVKQYTKEQRQFVIELYLQSKHSWRDIYNIFKDKFPDKKTMPHLLQSMTSRYINMRTKKEAAVSFWKEAKARGYDPVTGRKT